MLGWLRSSKQPVQPDRNVEEHQAQVNAVFMAQLNALLVLTVLTLDSLPAEQKASIKQVLRAYLANKVGTLQPPPNIVPPNQVQRFRDAFSVTVQAFLSLNPAPEDLLLKASRAASE